MWLYRKMSLFWEIHGELFRDEMISVTFSYFIDKHGWERRREGEIHTERECV